MKQILAIIIVISTSLCVAAVEFKFYPYELNLRHSFNLASMSRTSTPGVQVEIHLDSLVGYGEASMPPYLGESVQSVTDLLSKIDP